MSQDDRELKKYRQFLVDCEQRISAGYDKTILTLSGGALAISITFIKEIVGDREAVSASLALGSWVSWLLSLISVLSSYYFGLLAYRRAIQQVDAGKALQEVLGGIYSTIVNILNAVAGLTFVVGVLLFIGFAFRNLGGQT